MRWKKVSEHPLPEGDRWMHIIPTNDIDEHQDTQNCKCNPKIDVVNDNIIVIHNSFDGREFVEGDDKRN